MIIVSYIILIKKLYLLIYLIGESEGSSQVSQSTIDKLLISNRVKEKKALLLITLRNYY